jgi:uncharacterized glyoxalase superfamily protein PhnB
MKDPNRPVKRRGVSAVGVTALIAAALGLLATAAIAHLAQENQMKRLTPVLVVDEIEPVLPFWVDRLGFEKTAEVPEGETLGFVILERDGIQVMYQTLRSIANDVPALADTPAGAAFLFIEVRDVDAIERALEGVEPVIPRRKTFYGADEVVVRDPAGNVVTFAEFAEG